MSKLLIVDGSNLLFQMFFGMPARIVNADGKAIQGTLGFIGALFKIIRKVKPDQIVVIFDGETNNPRKELDESYKANRLDYSSIPEEENPFSQLPDIYAALDYLQIKHFETEDCEADDMIAGYAHRYGSQNEIVISSFDSDYFQLITVNVSVLRYRGENTLICTPKYIEEKLHILPSQYADFKAMTGDNADNIKGADKIGPKTAAVLLNEYGSLNKIIDNAEQIKKASVRGSISDAKERLQMNYRLIKLTGSCKLPFLPEQLLWQDTGITTNEVLHGIGLK